MEQQTLPLTEVPTCNIYQTGKSFLRLEILTMTCCLFETVALFGQAVSCEDNSTGSTPNSVHVFGFTWFRIDGGTVAPLRIYLPRVGGFEPCINVNAEVDQRGKSTGKAGVTWIPATAHLLTWGRHERVDGQMDLPG